MRCRHVSVGKNVELGTRKIVLAGASIDANVKVASLSLVMKSEHVQAPNVDFYWAGPLLQQITFPLLERRPRFIKRKINRQRRVTLELPEADASLVPRDGVGVAVSNPLALDGTGCKQDDLRRLAKQGDLDAIAALLKTDVTRGICASSAQQRRFEFGSNERPSDTVAPRSFLDLFAEACTKDVTVLLAIAAVVSIFVGVTLPNVFTKELDRSTGWIEGLAIIIAMLVVAVAGTLIGLYKERVFDDAQRAAAASVTRVRRDGVEQLVGTAELVAGDVVVLEGGARVPCDGLVIRGSALEAKQLLLAGSFVLEGHCELLAVPAGSVTPRGSRRRHRTTPRRRSWTSSLPSLRTALAASAPPLPSRSSLASC